MTIPKDHQSTAILYGCPDSISGAAMWMGKTGLWITPWYSNWHRMDIPIYGVVPQIDCLSSVRLVIFDRPKSLNWTWPEWKIKCVQQASTEESTVSMIKLLLVNFIKTNYIIIILATIMYLMYRNMSKQNWHNYTSTHMQCTHCTFFVD